MTYIGMIVDKSVSSVPCVLELQDRVKAFRTWPGQKIADNLVCIVC